MKQLNITLTRKWFDMIASGEKKEEYREIKMYWENRLVDTDDMTSEKIGDFIMGRYGFKKFDIVSATNGYGAARPNIKWKHEGITIGEGKPEWGAETGKKYFILKIGDLIPSGLAIAIED